MNYLTLYEFAKIKPEKIKEIMMDIRNWMIKKKLKLNEDKTECMLFGNENVLKNYEHLQYVKIGSSNIKTVTVLRNLGVSIDRNLTMKNQILNTVKICHHYLRNIAFIRKYLNEDTLKMLMYNHIMSRLDYCNSLYYELPNVLLKKLQSIQNKAARLIRKISLRERITPVLIDLHWLPIKARIIYKICLLTYKALKFGEPKYLRKHIIPFELETNIITRHAADRHRLYEPRGNKGAIARTFWYSAPRLYNKLPTSVKNSENVGKFKKNLKTHLFELCYDLEDKTLREQFKT